jgi:diguanylate cyclase (GGDEF)-like protein
MKADTSSRSLLRVPAGVMTIVSILGVIAYVYWVFSGRYDPELDGVISSAGLILLNLLVFAFGMQVVLDRRYSSKLRWGWSMLTFGALCFAIAEIVWMYYEQRMHIEPFPSAADLFYSLYYPLTLIGVLIFTFVFVSSKERGVLWLDLGILTIFTVMVAWYYFLAAPIFAGDPTLDKAILLLYPIGDFIILAAIIALIQRELSLAAKQILGFIAISMLCNVVGDILFAIYEFQGGDYVRAYLNVGWLCAAIALMMATARLIAAGPGLLNDPPARFSSLGAMLRLTIPYLAIVIGLTMLTIAVHTQPSPDIRLLGLLYGSMAVVGLAMLRQFLILKDNVRMAQSMRRIAWTDSLTGVYNRHFFNEMLPREMERAARYSHQLSLLMLDIDGFKTYNDTYGHLKGDTALRVMARVFTSQLRASDIIARFGGDEFVVILPETSRRKALNIADRIRSAVYTQLFEETNLSVSIGVTAFHAGLSPEQMVDEADKDMYRRKNAARLTRELNQSGPLSSTTAPTGDATCEPNTPTGFPLPGVLTGKDGPEAGHNGSNSEYFVTYSEMLPPQSGDRAGG